MKRAAFDPDLPLPPHGQPPVKTEVLVPCLWCGIRATYDTINTLGGRCHSCYTHYCRAAEPARKFPAGSVPAGAGYRAWAYRLKWREEQGEGLTPLQKSHWRDALQRITTGTAA